MERSENDVTSSNPTENAEVCRVSRVDNADLLEWRKGGFRFRVQGFLLCEMLIRLIIGLGEGIGRKIRGGGRLRVFGREAG